MIRLAHRSHLLTAIAAALTLGACGADSPTLPPTTGEPALVIRGAGGPAAASLLDNPGEGGLFGSAGSLTIKLYSLYISANADCSSPVLVQDLGASGADRDFMTNPVLFSGTPAAGTYQCVMMQMSDVLRMKPSTSFGGCLAGTEYAGDIYRTGENDWVNQNLTPIAGTGTDELPVDSHVTIFMARDTAAAIARGISTHQLVQLQTNLVVPGQSTFRMDASNAVATDGVRCGIEKPLVSFR
jgi:hypothetical protein